MYKLLVNYDIKENDSVEYANIIDEIQKQPDWLHLQLSSWIVESKSDEKDFYYKLLSLLNENTKSKIAVFDISRQKIFANICMKERKNIMSKTRLSSTSV